MGSCDSKTLATNIKRDFLPWVIARQASMIIHIHSQAVTSLSLCDTPPPDNRQGADPGGLHGHIDNDK